MTYANDEKKRDLVFILPRSVFIEQWDQVRLDPDFPAEYKEDETGQRFIEDADNDEIKILGARLVLQDEIPMPDTQQWPLCVPFYF